MQTILENYLVVVLIGMFFVFALIGYLIDLLRKDKNEVNKDVPKDIQEIQLAKVEEKTDNSVNNPVPTKTEELLTNYDNTTINNQSINENDNVNTPH